MCPTICPHPRPKLEETPAHGFVRGLTQEEYDECDKYARS
jgi:hypothetical protein